VQRIWREDGLRVPPQVSAITPPSPHLITEIPQAS